MTMTPDDDKQLKAWSAHRDAAATSALQAAALRFAREVALVGRTTEALSNACQLGLPYVEPHEAYGGLELSWVTTAGPRASLWLLVRAGDDVDVNWKYERYDAGPDARTERGVTTARLEHTLLRAWISARSPWAAAP